MAACKLAVLLDGNQPSFAFMLLDQHTRHFQKTIAKREEQIWLAEGDCAVVSCQTWVFQVNEYFIVWTGIIARQNEPDLNLFFAS